MVDPLSAYVRFVGDARAEALRTQIDPRATSPGAPESIDARGGSREDGDFDSPEVSVDLHGDTLTLRATESDVRRTAASTYMVGGFDLVRDLHRAIRHRQKLDHQRVSQLDSAVESLRGMREDALPRLSASWDQALRTQIDQIVPSEQRERASTLIERMLRAEWQRIAAAEEQVLREYEPMAISRFVALAKEAEEIALREWARYEPHDPSAPATPLLNTQDAKSRGPAALKLRNESGALLAQVRALHTAWTNYLEAASSASDLAKLGARRVKALNPLWKPEFLLEGSRAHAAKKFKDFEALRIDIGSRFPVALQVYGRISSLVSADRSTTDEEIETWVIESLIEAVESAQRMAYAAVQNPIFRGGQTLRVEPDSAAVHDLPAYQVDDLANGLTVPASRVMANRLSDPAAAATSPWCQLPVRLSLFWMGAGGNPRLTPYFTPGRLHHAALADVNNALQEVRERLVARQDQALLIMDAIAIPLSFLTGGGSIAVAGTIHAVVRAREMYLSVQEYRARDELASLAMVPMSQAIWEHPSAVVLTGKLLENGFQIATDLVTEGIAGAVMDAVQVSLALGYGASAVKEWAAGDDPLRGA